MEHDRSNLRAFYRRYLARCNEHRFDELGEFVDENVVVNDTDHGLRKYADGLVSVVEAFPDFHWDLRHLLVDGDWLTAHLIDTGTTTTGRCLTLQEFALYRVADGRIVQSWGDLERTRLAI